MIRAVIPWHDVPPGTTRQVGLRHLGFVAAAAGAFLVVVGLAVGLLVAGGMAAARGLE